MILNNTPQDQAVLSNVGQIGEFRIRNSAKAFSILSSGLYANKIRAIIRELSCNAVDSHVAAGKSETPYDVHLPNMLEPWFSIRDYGTGLTHDQVTNIYTTYFESSKTDSNEFIGALGLGSKSPFAYTDNFTVTAVHNNHKGIYTAFINESGVPSIALMMEEDTTEPNGIEVKFSVNERYDYDKFRREALEVYRHFARRPVVSGYSGFAFSDPDYTEKDIIPGVHTSNRRGDSIAVMGNIAYPISIPESDKTLGDLRPMLDCGLTLEFGIGELDFQASREGLSYVPLTINSIKAKLEALNAQLSVHIATEADKIKNLWERGLYIVKRTVQPLWAAAANKYAVDSKYPNWNPNHATSYAAKLKPFEFNVNDLESKFNISLKGFIHGRNQLTCTTIKVHSERPKVVGGAPELSWVIPISADTYFVFNDCKVGCSVRAKNHWRNTEQTASYNHVYVIEPVDKKKPIKKVEFLKALLKPPEKQVMFSSSLTVLTNDKVNVKGKYVRLLKLEERRLGRWRTKIAWGRSTLEASDLCSNTTYYYLPVVGHRSIGKVANVETMQNYLKQADIFSGDIYGVRKCDMEFIKSQKNWINLDEYVVQKLTTMASLDLLGLVKQAIDLSIVTRYNVLDKISKDSPYAKLALTFKDVKAVDSSVEQSMDFLCRVYDVKTAKSDPAELIKQYKKDIANVHSRYPLLEHVSSYSVDKNAVVEYINLIDQANGV